VTLSTFGATYKRYPIKFVRIWLPEAPVMRRSIDDHPADPADVPPGLDGDLSAVSWAVAISDDYDDAEPRVVLTVEEVGRAGEGLVTHLSPDIARRLRVALRDALREIGEPTGD
jgi:hypothetical protein